MKLPTILNQDGRRAWAFAAIVGACIVMTAFAFFGVWQVRFIAKYTFYLALAAHAQILVGLTCIGALLVRRVIKAGKDGIEISDSADAIQSGDSVTVVKE